MPSILHSVRTLRKQVYSGGYALAFMSVLLAFLLRLSLDSWLRNQQPYVTFIVAVAVTGLFAGVRPALVALALGAGIAYFGFVPPRYQWGFAGTGDAVGFGVYLLAAGAIILLTRARIHAAAKAEHSLKNQIEAERKLLDAETLFREFMDNSSACAYLRDEEGRCVYANEAAKREFGIESYPPGEQLAIASGFRGQDQQVLKAGHAMQFVDRGAGPGRERYWLTSKFPFIELSGHRFVGGISFEITDRMQAEQVLRKTERLSAAGRMASLLAHEINNPLAALTNLLFLLNQESLALPAREFVSQANDELARINRIAAMTLSFYFEKDTPAPLRICQIIDEVATTLTAMESFRNVQLVREFGSDPKIVGSPPRIRQLIANLLTNAMESGAQTVRIRVCEGRDWRDRDRTGVRITIADNGRGIPFEFRDKLFEPFFTTKCEKGVGLGLWASRTVVLRNEGTIRLRTNAQGPGRGTCVRVFLPIVEAPEVTASAGRAARMIHG